MTHDTNSAPAPSDPLAEWEALAEETNWLLRWQDYPGRNRALRKSAEAIPALIGMVRERDVQLKKAWAAANEYRDNMFVHLDRATAAEEMVKELEEYIQNVDDWKPTASEADAAAARKRVRELETAMHAVIACDHHNHSDGPPPRYVTVAREALGRQA